MNSTRLVTSLLLMSLVAYFCVVAWSRRSLSQTGKEWGQPENGLRMSIFPAQESQDSSVALQYRASFATLEKITCSLNWE